MLDIFLGPAGYDWRYVLWMQVEDVPDIYELSSKFQEMPHSKMHVKMK